MPNTLLHTKWYAMSTAMQIRINANAVTIDVIVWFPLSPLRVVLELMAPEACQERAGLR